MIIRDALPKDLEDMVRLEKISFTYPYPPHCLGVLIRHALCLVAFEGNKLVGYATATLDQGKGHILSMAVDPAFRRRGIGTALLKALLNRLKGADTILLEVREGNEAGRHLYGSQGFMVTGRMLNYYPDGEGALVMSKRFKHGDVGKHGNVGVCS